MRLWKIFAFPIRHKRKKRLNYVHSICYGAISNSLSCLTRFGASTRLRSRKEFFGPPRSGLWNFLPSKARSQGGPSAFWERSSKTLGRRRNVFQYEVLRVLVCSSSFPGSASENWIAGAVRDVDLRPLHSVLENDPRCACRFIALHLAIFPPTNSNTWQVHSHSSNSNLKPGYSARMELARHLRRICPRTTVKGAVESKTLHQIAQLHGFAAQTSITR